VIEGSRLANDPRSAWSYEGREQPSDLCPSPTTLKGTLRIHALAEVKHSMSEEKSYQCDAPGIHCFLDGRFECECGEEWHDGALAEMILGLTTVESHSFEAMGAGSPRPAHDQGR
jgi:hypothetical protein